MPKSAAAYIDVGSDPCANRHRGNPASRDAFTNGESHHQRDRMTAYGLICAAREGMTSKEVAERMGKALNAVSGRLSELRSLGKVRGTGARRDGAEVLVSTDGEQQSLGLKGVA